MRMLFLLLALAGRSLAAPEVQVVRLHAENLAFMAAMPPGGPALPLAAGQPLAGLSPMQLQAVYQTGRVLDLPALAPASVAAVPAAPTRGPPVQAAAGLIAEPYAPQPSVEKLRAWLGGARPRSLDWVFDGLDPALKKEIEEQAGADPVAFARKRYEMEGALYELFLDLPELVTTWRARGAVPEQLRTVLDDSFLAGRQVRSVITPRVWRQLLPSQQAAVARGLHAGRIREGARLRLDLAGADPAALARKYAAGRDPRPIERLLRARIAAGETQIPLEAILPKHVRRRVGTFADCTGPNCVNAVMSSRDFYDDATGLMAELNANYRRMPEGEPILPGDKLVYADASKRLVHVAESVGDGWVFTKNGMGRQYPYVFQRQEAMEAVHFPSGEFRLIVFRP